MTTEIKFITSSDEHLADIAPGFRKDDYRGEILSILEWQGLQASRFEANAVIRAGDFFHVKAANRTTMSTMAMAAKIHSNYKCKTLSVTGNHDMSYNDIESIPRQPIGVMYESGMFQNLKDETFESGSMKVRLVGVDYTTDLDNDGLCDLVRKKDENFTIAVVHMLATMAPKEKMQSFFNEKIFDYRDLVFNGCPDVYVFGHYHKDQGIVQHLGTQFVNLGAISRGALTFENIERKPKISMITIRPNGISIEEVIAPHKDASEVFDMDKKKTLDKQKESMDTFVTEFVSKLSENSASNTGSQKEIYAEKMKDFPEDVRKLSLQILEDAEQMEQD